MSTMYPVDKIITSLNEIGPLIEHTAPEVALFTESGLVDRLVP